MVERYPQQLAPENTIIFLGSAFSYDAKNLNGHNVPSAKTLTSTLSQHVGADPNTHNLRDIADEFADQPDTLYDILYSTFTVSQCDDHQKQSLSFPWRRIYTTNYDDLAELCLSNLNETVPSYSIADKRPNKLPKKSIIHLHGHIRHADSKNILNALVLNEESYIRQFFENTEWYMEFAHDLKHADAVIFLGYGLNDYHIASLLLKDPTLQQKTFFVIPEDYDSFSGRRFSAYGSLVPIGVEKFPEFCRSLPRAQKPQNLHQLNTFKFIESRPDSKSLRQPTAPEIRDLFTRGEFRPARAYATLPKSAYVSPRSEKTQEATEQLSRNRTLLVHSRIGNGKSIFLHILAHSLNTKGYHCFFMKLDAELNQNEIALLQEYPNVVIIIDHYNTAIKCLRELSTQLPSAKFVITVRSGVQEARLHEWRDVLPRPFKRVNLNLMSRAEKEDFHDLLDESGLRRINFDQIINTSRDVRDIVMKLYENIDIKREIENEIKEAFQYNDFRDTFVAYLVLRWVGLDVDPVLIRTAVKHDPFVSLGQHPSLAKDMFIHADEEVQLRSSLFSEFVLETIIDVQHIFAASQALLKVAVRNKQDRDMRTLLSDLMQVRTLTTILQKRTNTEHLIEGFYEEIRLDCHINKEPLFWLQYSILMMQTGRLQDAEMFLQTSYDRAAQQEDFRTYQIDTHALRLYLLCEKNLDAGQYIHRFENISKAMGDVTKLIYDDSHRPYVVDALSEVESFIAARINDISRQQANTLVYHLNLLLEQLDKLSAEDRAISGSEKTKFSLERAKKILLDKSDI